MSSDGGGCLPVFNENGEIVEMDIGSPAMLASTLAELLRRDWPLEKILPPFTSNVADVLRLHERGRVREGGMADFVVLDDKHGIHDVMVGGVWHLRGGIQQVFGQFENASSR